MAENSPSPRHIPLGSGLLKKVRDLLIGRKKKVDDEVDKATGAETKKVTIR